MWTFNLITESKYLHNFHACWYLSGESDNRKSGYVEGFLSTDFPHLFSGCCRAVLCRNLVNQQSVMACFGDQWTAGVGSRQVGVFFCKSSLLNIIPQRLSPALEEISYFIALNVSFIRKKKIICIAPVYNLLSGEQFQSSLIGQLGSLSHFQLPPSNSCWVWVTAWQLSS